MTFRRVLLNKCQKEFERERKINIALEKEDKEKKFYSVSTVISMQLNIISDNPPPPILGEGEF